MFKYAPIIYEHQKSIPLYTASSGVKPFKNSVKLLSVGKFSFNKRCQMGSVYGDYCMVFLLLKIKFIGKRYLFIFIKVIE